MNSDLVSIVIPVYNAEQYISTCIESIAQQTYKNIEVVMVDDGSKDSSLLRCKEERKNHPFLRVHAQTNQGVSVARNIGTELARGEWICYIDPDDWIEPNYVEELVKEANRVNADIVICDTFLNYPTKQVETYHLSESRTMTSKDDFENLQLQLIAKKASSIQPNSGDLLGAPWGKIYRKAFIQENGLQYIVGLKRSQDCMFNLYCLEYAKVVSYIQKCLHHYRYNPDSVTNKYSPETIPVVNHYLSELDTFISRFGKDSRFTEAQNVKIVTSLYKCFRLDCFNRDNPASSREQLASAKKLMRSSPYIQAIKNVNLAQMSKQEALFACCVKLHANRMIRLVINLRETIRKG